MDFDSKVNRRGTPHSCVNVMTIVSHPYVSLKTVGLYERTRNHKSRNNPKVVHFTPNDNVPSGQRSGNPPVQHTGFHGLGVV